MPIKQFSQAAEMLLIQLTLISPEFDLAFPAKSEHFSVSCFTGTPTELQRRIARIDFYLLPNL